MKVYLAGVLLFFALVLSFRVASVELKPWFDPMFELQSRAASTFQLYRGIDTREGVKAKPAGNYFLDLELYTTLLQNWSIEIEAVLAATRHRTFGPDSCSLTGRYLWLDDVAGDPISLTTGLTVYKVFKLARHDLSVFHHGGIECELHAAAGKEVSCWKDWSSRAWVVGGFGIADSGSPWSRADAHWEHNWNNKRRLRFSLLSVWGLGHHSLKSLACFRGYGPIQHSSIDAVLRYTSFFNHGVSFSIAYAYRVLARNCPVNVNFILFTLDYPISL